ncbi:MAG TPA: histidine kinase dimerization/phospho-acceptor domain-containing protein [Mucilaginibacter sp.]|jgi:signal transduction histidine kinase|nr:histidine kinase dimerization/phospho-acceptor domain-containing protein [Mucilaginibacter sp.]
MEIFNSKSELTRSGGFAVKGNEDATIAVEQKYSYKLAKADGSNDAKYIETIELQNQKLSEIAWLQSHIVRTPLARILGLIEVISDFREKEEITTILEYISQSANELDAVIREISDKSAPVMPGMIA